MGVIAIIGAMPEEIEGIREHMENVRERVTAFGVIYEGEIAGREVCLMCSGVGKVLTAAAATMLCLSYHVDLLIMTGVGGALNPEYKIGDVCVGVEYIQWDMDASAVGFAIGEVPYANLQIVPADAASVALLRSRSIPGVTVHYGRIGTGDTFVAEDSLRGRILGLEVDVVEMETAAAAFVAHVFQIPFIGIRAISDDAGHTAPGDFAEMLPKLVRTNWQVIEVLIKG